LKFALFAQAAEAVIVMLRLAVAVASGDSESATVTVKLDVEAALGEPEITPVELRLKPAVRLPPVRLHL
jgi:hypothetical protein